MAEGFKLSPGVGFHLKESGEWEPEEIPQEVIDTAEVSGHLTIKGHRCTVFETQDKDMWAQKSRVGPTKTNTSAFFKEVDIMDSLANRVAAKYMELHGISKGPDLSDISSRVAARYLESKNKGKRDVTSIVKKIMSKPGDDTKYDKEIANYGKTIRKSIPKIQKTLDKAVSELEAVSAAVSQHDHGKIAKHHCSIVQDEIGRAISTIRVAASSLVRNLSGHVEEWDPEK